MFGQFCMLCVALLLFAVALLEGSVVCVLFSLMAGAAAYGIHLAATMPRDATWVEAGKVRLASLCIGIVMFMCPPVGLIALVLSLMVNAGGR